MQPEKKKLYQPYVVMLAVYVLFTITALLHNSPGEIYLGLQEIVRSRSVLLTDYIQVGGIGATLVNSALVGSFTIFMLVVNGVKPNGSIIMALWLTTGFALFGKNMFNMLPLTLGVFLYSKYQKEPFINYSLTALLSATLSPVVSGISFSGEWGLIPSIFIGIFLGIAAGFIFPAVSSFTMRVHEGYNLYNMGFSGGLISTFLVAGFASAGVKLEINMIWGRGYNTSLAVLLYIISAGLMVCGLVWGGGLETIKNYPKLLRHHGRLVTDFFAIFGRSAYFNMGLMGVISTTIMLVLGCDLNGPTLGGIFTIIGFSAFGKHPGNVMPVMLGAIIATRLNMWDHTMPPNTLAILFSAGLAPFAGQFGWLWGIVAGILHVNTVLHIGFMNSGLNLYNNGYAAGFVALLLLPIIQAFRKEKGKQHAR